MSNFDKEVPMRTQEISEVLGLTSQQVRNIAREKRWKAIREGTPGRGLGSLFSRRDVVAEARERLQQARADVRRIDAWLSDIKAEEDTDEAPDMGGIQ